MADRQQLPEFGPSGVGVSSATIVREGCIVFSLGSDGDALRARIRSIGLRQTFLESLEFAVYLQAFRFKGQQTRVC